MSGHLVLLIRSGAATILLLEYRATLVRRHPAIEAKPRDQGKERRDPAFGPSHGRGTRRDMRFRLALEAGRPSSQASLLQPAKARARRLHGFPYANRC